MKKNFRRIHILRLVILLFPILITSITYSASNNIFVFNFVEDELLIQPKAGVPEEKIESILKSSGAFVEDEIQPIKVKKIKIPLNAIEKIKNALSKNPHFNFVENNFIASTAQVPNDYYYNFQWHIPKISAPDGWNITTGSTDIPIAIIDSGVDPTHPDLSGKLLQGYNFLNESFDTHDVLGHGTAVSGAAGAISNNYTGVSGIAWDNPIMPLVVLNSSNYATYYDIARAITYAVDRGIRIINISIGGSSSSSTLQNAVNYAWNKGAIIFASAMNNATNIPYYPAACNNVVAVSATTLDDTLASFSNYGSWIDISAPGVSIYTTTNGSSYGYKSGTSFASPISAGLSALILSANPTLTNQELLNIIKNNADDLGEEGYDIYYGWGRINVFKSLLSAINLKPVKDTEPPVVSIIYPSDNSTLLGDITITISAKDNTGVSKVELYINNSLYAATNSEPYNFYWDTNNELNGIYNIYAIAYDTSGNIGKSNSITVFVSNPKDNLAPTLIIKSPQDGAYITKNSKIYIQAYDNIQVTKIELYIDSVFRKSVINQNSLTYIWDIKKEAKGSHSINAIAYDSSGNSSSTSITVYK